MNAPAASAALAGAVPRGATILLGEWQHGCGSSILSKMAFVQALVNTGHRLHILMEARSHDLLEFVSALGTPHESRAIGLLPQIYRTRELIEMVRYSANEPLVSLDGYDFRFGSTTSLKRSVAQVWHKWPQLDREFPVQAAEATIRPWDHTAAAALAKVPTLLLDDMERDGDASARELVANVRYAQLISLTGGLGLNGAGRPRLSASQAVAAFNYRDRWCAKRILTLGGSQGRAPVTTLVWCAAIHAAKSLKQVGRSTSFTALVPLGERLHEEGLVALSLATTTRQGTYLDPFRLGPVSVRCTPCCIENRLPAGLWVVPQQPGTHRAAPSVVLGMRETSPTWHSVFDRVMVIDDARPVSLYSPSLRRE